MALKGLAALSPGARILGGCEALATHDRVFRRGTEVDPFDVG
jgi:hypothetical protein